MCSSDLLEWLQSQKVETLSDRLLHWVEFFSLFDFQQQYIPGVDNVIPDQLSRPATSICVGADGARRDLDLVSLATLLQDHQDVTLGPTPPDVDGVDVQGLQDSFATELRAAQRADPELNAIIRRMEAVDYNPLADQFRPIYELANQLLVVPEPDGRQRVVVPVGPLREQICKFCHDEAGHPGGHRTLHTIAHFFFWPNMHRQVQAYVSGCAVCQAAKASNRLPAGYGQPHEIPPEAGSEWSVDFIELPRSNNGHNLLLVFSERISKLVVLVPLQSAPGSPVSSQVVARAYFEHVFCWFGVPKVLLSDRGPQFRSGFWHELWALLGTTVKHSTPHTPHSHGDVERQNRVINEMCRSLLQEQFTALHSSWDEYVKLIQFTMNTTVVGRTGMTPLFFFFGRQPRVPATLDMPTTSLDPASIEFVESFRSRLQAARDQARMEQCTLLKTLNSRRDPRLQFHVGGFAWLRSEECPIPGDKHFRLPWAGPYKVVAVTPSTATLELPEHWRLLSNTFHFNKLLPFRESLARRAAVGPRSGVMISLENGPQEVERLLRQRWVGRRSPTTGQRRCQYWVKWYGLPAGFNSWVEAHTLRAQPGGDDLIRTYLRDNPAARDVE